MKKALKVRIDVKVSLSHETLLFLQSVLGGNVPDEHQPLKLVEKPVEPTKTVEKPVEPTKTVEKPVETKKSVETAKTVEKPVEPTKTVEKPVETAKTDSTTEKPNIESIRSLLGTKVNEFRKDIKDKLTEFGAKNVTTLDESKYVEFYKFLQSLK